jgi:hypothetical protein
MLTVSFHFKVLEGEEPRFWEAVKLREQFVVNFSAMARTAVQRMYEVMGFKVRQEQRSGRTMNAADLALMYKKGELAADSEQITEDMARNIISVHNDMLSVGTIRTLLLQADEQWGQKSPFNSVISSAT